MDLTTLKTRPISLPLMFLHLCNFLLYIMDTAALPEYEQHPLLLGASDVPQAMGSVPSSEAGKTTYRAVGGFFAQDHPDGKPSGFDYMESNFGLINRSYASDDSFDPNHKATQWQCFAHFVLYLNENTSPRVEYKVLFVGRHGEAWHNVAEAYYGHDDWEDYWSKQPGNATTNWTDPSLTPRGIDQAHKVRDFWTRQLDPKKEHMPAPESFYVSPLARCLETARLIFQGLPAMIDETSKSTKSQTVAGLSGPFQPTVKELLRETIGIHTCDKRSSQTWIHEHYPNYKFEGSFTELDELWEPDNRETDAKRDARAIKLLDDLFGDGRDKHIFISLTGHGGISRSLLRVLQHQAWRLETTDIIPILMRIDRAKAK